MAEFEIDGRTYGYLRPYVIAEIGVNHEGSLARAKSMIEMIARSGAHAAKFQTYSADLLAVPDYSPAYWDLNAERAVSQHALFSRYDSFGPAEYADLARHCEHFGIDFLSTPFDLQAVDALAPLMPAVKIASADITNIPLLRKVAGTGKPIILSTGASTFAEIGRAVSVMTAAGAADIALLHCVLNYPTLKPLAAIARLDRLKDEFGRARHAVGYSDHVAPDEDGAMPALELAAIRGAVVLEKHFTDNKLSKGNDHYHAMDEADLTKFIKRLNDYSALYGDGQQNLHNESAAIQNARRRIVTVRAVHRGHVLSEADLVTLRANQGIEASEWDQVIGRTLNADLPAGHLVSWSDIS